MDMSINVVASLNVLEIVTASWRLKVNCKFLVLLRRTSEAYKTPMPNFHLYAPLFQPVFRVSIWNIH